ncbi:Oxaloacetate decarboxylase [compost metagenome]
MVDGHAACFAAIKATYDSLREQRGIAIGNGLSASELVTRYTYPDDYIAWAREHMNVRE